MIKDATMMGNARYCPLRSKSGLFNNILNDTNPNTTTAMLNGGISLIR